MTASTNEVMLHLLVAGGSYVPSLGLPVLIPLTDFVFVP